MSQAMSQALQGTEYSAQHRWTLAKADYSNVDYEGLQPVDYRPHAAQVLALTTAWRQLKLREDDNTAS
jgi:hypothetical protein